MNVFYIATLIYLGTTAMWASTLVSMHWDQQSEAVDGYRVYKGDVNGRVFELATSVPAAVIDMMDGESMFVASYRGVLESLPSAVLNFEQQHSNDLSQWHHISTPLPVAPKYFTRFKVESNPQPEAILPNNIALLPQTPQTLELNCSYPRPQQEFQPLGISELPTPWIIAHRGGKNVAPAHTMEAYRMCVASGIRFIEPDVQVLPDGTVVVMHDQTIDATTTGTGRVIDQTYESWQLLFNDDGARLPGWATNLKCPIFDDVLREFGNRVVIVPEAKNTGAGAAIVRKLQEYNIRNDMVIIQSPSLAELAPAIAAGYPCMRMSSINYAETINAGIEFTGFGAGETAKIAAATSMGLRVIVWTTERNADLEPALSAGAIAAFSDEPVYQAGLHRMSHDQYGSKAFYHGDIRSSRVTLDTAESAIMVSTKTWVAQDTVLLGWASPVKVPDNFVLNFSMKFADVASDSAFGVIATQTTDRAIINDTPEVGKVSMNMIIRRDGRIELHVSDGIDGGPAAVSSEAAIPADLIALNVWVPCRLTVTPASITLERLDKQVSATIVNHQVRGAYLFAGSKGANVKFRSMTLTE